jgi:hypothetical protein
MSRRESAARPAWPLANLINLASAADRKLASTVLTVSYALKIVP